MKTSIIAIASIAWQLWKISLVMLVVGCAMGSSNEPYLEITPDDPISPKRIRFDVRGTPYAESQDKSLDVYERIRLGMKQFAGEQLGLQKYCPHGFRGPDLVLMDPRDRAHNHFFVECITPP